MPGARSLIGLALVAVGLAGCGESAPPSVSMTQAVGAPGAAAPVAADQATTSATAVAVAPAGTVAAKGGGRIEVVVTCPVQGRIDGLFITVEQRWRGQTTTGHTNWGPAAIPCSPQGTRHDLGLEVFTDVYYGPGPARVTKVTACGAGPRGCVDFTRGQPAVVLHERAR